MLNLGVVLDYDYVLLHYLTLSLLMSHINGAPSKARNLTYIYIYTQHAHPQYSIDCSSIERLSEGTRNAP
jgi:hypothetical protein